MLKLLKGLLKSGRVTEVVKASKDNPERSSYYYPGTDNSGFNNIPDRDMDQIGTELREKIKKVCKGSLHIRYVDAGACNACDFEINALPNPIYDIQQYGIDFVASPRHADMLLITGVVTRNLEIALMKTYEACPKPTLVVAVGDCACGKGIFQDAYASGGGVNNFLPVDIFVPGCPPPPDEILKGILAAIDRIK